MTEDTFVNRVRKTAELIGGQLALAQKTGISARTINAYALGESEPSMAKLISISKATGVSISWLATGEGQMMSGSPIDPMSASESHMLSCVSAEPLPCTVSDGVISIPQWENPDPDAFDYIPMADTQLSAGGGCFVISERVEGYYAFKKSWLNRVATSAKNLVLMRVHGGSMDPTIQDADTVMIDTGRRNIREGMIYALRVDSTIMIKRLSFRTGGKVLVISDNRQEYESYEAAIKDLFIIGQIIFFSRTFVPD